MEIELQLIKATARQVDKHLEKAIKKLCPGCYDRHSTLNQHDCAMIEDPEDRIRYGLNKALEMVDWRRVSDDWWSHLSVIHILRCPRQHDDLKWLSNLWNEHDMKEKLIAALMRGEKKEI